MKTFDLDDIETLEGEDEVEPLDAALALQRAINSSMWSLQGSYGRSMMDAIKAGDCALGHQETKDYWGNHIPSRTQVKAGTKGSLEFVEANRGPDWRKAIEEA